MPLHKENQAISGRLGPPAVKGYRCRITAHFWSCGVFMTILRRLAGGAEGEYAIVRDRPQIGLSQNQEMVSACSHPLNALVERHVCKILQSVRQPETWPRSQSRFKGNGRHGNGTSSDSKSLQGQLKRRVPLGVGKVFDRKLQPEGGAVGHSNRSLHGWP
jgi:hypothetical protein